MKFDAHWQPLRNEDAQTALVFGFLKHAPVYLALDRWLTDVLERPVSGQPLTRVSFWPRYPASHAGGVYTEPDVIIEAGDGEPLLVIVEAKPAYGQHTAQQLSREALDASRHLKPSRIAVVLVGADLAPPGDITSWESHARQQLSANGMADVAVELRYSSWNRLARAIMHTAASDQTWRSYADDVLFRLRAKGVLDYEGAPVIDDLDGLTLSNAVEAYHRIMRAFRTLALSVHSQSATTELGLEPYEGPHTLLRDGRTIILPGDPSSFETNILLVPYRSPGWPERCGAFFSAWLTGDEEPHLEVGAFETRAGRADLPWGFAGAELVDDVESTALAAAPRETLDLRAASTNTEWLYAERKWTPGDGEGDVAWIIDGLSAAARLWEDSSTVTRLGPTDLDLTIDRPDDDE